MSPIPRVPLARPPRVFGWLLLALAPAACNLPTTDSNSATDLDSGDGLAAAVQGCKDVADAYSKAAAQCGGTYDVAYKLFLNRTVNGSCDNVLTLRDRASLYDACIPSFASISCADLNNGVFNAACTNQLGL